MSIESNRNIVNRIYREVNDAKRYDVLDELCQPDVKIHDPLAGELQGLEAFRGLFAFFGQGFPTQQTELQDCVAENDYVALLHVHHAVNDGPFNGMPATGRTVHVPGIELYRFRDGKIAEFWRFDADLSLMMQLGTIPAPVAA